MSTTSTRIRRLTATALTALALLGATATTADAAVVAPAAHVAGHVMIPAHVQHVRAHSTITAQVSTGWVRPWQAFRVYGKATTATHVKAGSWVTVQRWQNKRWENLPVHAAVNSHGQYSVRVELGTKGVNHLRVVGAGRVASKGLVVVVAK